MTTCLGKSCSFGLLRVPFVNCCQFMYLVISLLVLRAGCGIWLYRFLIIACLFTFHPVYRGKSLKCDQRNTAQEMLLDLNSDLVPDLLKFMSESTPTQKPWDKSLTINSVTADVWWHCMERQEANHGRFMYISIETVVYACQFSSNWKIFFKFWDDPVQS